MRAGVATSIALACVIPVAAHAQGDRWERHVHEQLQRAAASLAANGGGTVLGTRLGMLNTDESDSFTVTLHAGTRYIVLGACDADCSRLGLVVSDGASHDVAADRAGDNTPLVRITAGKTASYRIKTDMERCSMNPCRYGVVVVTPPAP